MYQAQFLEKIKTHFLLSILFFSRTFCCLCDNVGQHGRAREATYDNIIWRMRIACWITEVTETLKRYLYLYLLLVLINNYYTNSAHCFVLPMLPVLLRLLFVIKTQQDVLHYVHPRRHQNSFENLRSPNNTIISNSFCFRSWKMFR